MVCFSDVDWDSDDDWNFVNENDVNDENDGIESQVVEETIQNDARYSLFPQLWRIALICLSLILISNERKTGAKILRFDDLNPPSNICSIDAVKESDPVKPLEWIKGLNIGADLAGIHASPSPATNNHPVPRPSLLYNRQGAPVLKNDDVAWQKHRLFSTGEVKLHEPGLTTIKGYLPSGAKLKVSTPNGATVVVTTEHPAFVSTVAGKNSFQFFGDSRDLYSSFESYHKAKAGGSSPTTSTSAFEALK